MLRRIAVVLTLASLPACGGVGPSKNRTDSFTGLIPKGAAQQHFDQFSSKSGELTITVTSLTPAVPSSTQFGLIFGRPDSSGCTALIDQRFVSVGFPVTEITYSSGLYCVAVYDAFGVFAADETYTLTVNHP